MPTATLGMPSAISVHASAVRMHSEYACIRVCTLAYARHFNMRVSHSFVFCGIVWLVAREGWAGGKGHASTPSRKSPTELEDHAGGPAANVEG